MSTHQGDRGIVVDGRAPVEFAREWTVRGDSTAVEITLEVGCAGYGGCGVHDRYITIGREDWDAIVAHVAIPPATPTSAAPATTECDHCGCPDLYEDSAPVDDHSLTAYWTCPDCGWASEPVAVPS